MKAIIKHDVVKFLVQDEDGIVSEEGKLKINFADDSPSLFVPSISFSDILVIEGVTEEELPDFTGDKYQYTDDAFSLITE